jgi:peptide/nickel transport system substrate-binding protein
VRVGVAEGGDTDAQSVGFKKIWPLRTLEGLIDNRGSDGRPRPGVAESWQVSDDGLLWRLTLRANVTFHDGSRCDAKAVKAILDDALASPAISEFPGLLDVKSVNAEDDRTLVINLRRPSAFLLSDLYIDIAKAGPNGTKIGTGPYYFAEQTDTSVVLRAHTHYSQGTPKIQRLIFQPYPTLRQAWSSLLRGEIDALWNMSGDALEFLTSESIETFSFPRHYAYVMAFNSKRPTLRTPAVRRALNAAINRKVIIETVLKGRGRPADTPIWPGHWAYDQSVSGYSYDPSLAKTTLEALGIGGFTRSSGEGGRLVIKCMVPKDRATLEKLALSLQTQLYDVGIDLQLESVSLSEFDKRLRGGNFDAAVFDMGSGAALSRVYLFWRSPGEYAGLNVFGYRNPAADKWLDMLRFAQDDATTRAATSQLQRVMLDDPPGVFVAWSEQTRAVSRRINVESGQNQDPFEVLWKWHFATTESRLTKR